MQKKKKRWWWPNQHKTRRLVRHGIVRIIDDHLKFVLDDLNSDVEEDKTADNSPSKEFSLRIPRINLPEEEKKKQQQQQRISSSSSSSLNEEPEAEEEEKPTVKKKRRSTKSKKKPEQSPKSDEKPEPTPDENTKKLSQKKDANDRAQSRIDHLKKLLRLSGIRAVMKKSELEPFSSNKAKINYLQSLFQSAGFTGLIFVFRISFRLRNVLGSLTIKECEKFRQKRDTEKELLEIQASAVDVKGLMNFLPGTS